MRSLLDGRFYLETEHAKDKMKALGIGRDEIEFVLRNGNHVPHRNKYNESFENYSYAFEGRVEMTGRELRVAVVICRHPVVPNESVLVVTVIDLNE